MCIPEDEHDNLTVIFEMRSRPHAPADVNIFTGAVSETLFDFASRVRKSRPAGNTRASRRFATTSYAGRPMTHHYRMLLSK